MAKYDENFMEEIKKKMELELLGVVPIETSSPKKLKEQAYALLPSARFVLVLGKEILKEVLTLVQPSSETGEANPGDLLITHFDYLNGRLTRAANNIAEIFRKDGYLSLPLPARRLPLNQKTITSIFSYKHAAELAGLGVIGRHSLLISRRYGPRVRLTCLLTEAPLQASSSERENYCLNCDACIRMCPAQAL